MTEPAKKPPAPIPVTTQGGTTGYLPAEYAQDAAEIGGIRQATDAEMQAAQGKANEALTAQELQAQFAGIGGGIEGAVGPALAGAARGLSIGTSDEALLNAAGMLGGRAGREAVRRRLADYQAYAPVTSAVGELGGIAAGALLGDEAGIAGAPAAVSRLGAGAEGLAVRALGDGALGRGAGYLARGAVEGGIFGAGSAYSEASLSDHALTSEALIGGVKRGALGGMIASGLVGAASEGLGAVGRRFRAPSASAEGEGLTSLTKNTFGESAEGVGPALQKELGGHRTSGRLTEGPGDAVADAYIRNRPTSSASERELHAEAWAKREQVFSKHAETIEKASRDFSGALDDALAAGRKADMASFGEAKVNQMSRLVDQSRFADQSNAVIDWMVDANKVIKDISGDATAGLGPSALKKWNGHLAKVAEGIESGDSVKLHTALDNTKRFLGQEAAFGKGPFGLTVAQREFDGLYQGEQGLKGLLESNVWGDAAATAQRDINSATHRMLSEGKLFSRKFTTEFGSEAGRPLYAADTSAVNGFMNRLTSAGNDLDARGVESWINARRNFLGAIQKNYEFDAGAAKAISKESAALDKLESVYKGATKDVTLANQVKSALQEERERGFGGAIGAMFDVASKPLTTLQRLAQIEANTKGILGKLSDGTKALVGGAKAPKSAGLPVPKGSNQGFFTSLLDGAGRSVAGTAPAAGYMASTYAKRVDQIATLRSNPTLLSERVGNSLGPFANAAPKVTAMATETALRGLDYLATKLPPSRVDKFSLQPQLQSTRASDAEISKFMRTAQAVDDPLIVLQEAKNGTLTRDHVEAVKAVYPNLYAEMQTTVMRYVVDSKQELPYDKRIQLGILLDIPTDKSLSPDFLRAVQATYSDAEKAGTESPSSQSVAPQIAGSVQTATQGAVERAE